MRSALPLSAVLVFVVARPLAAQTVFVDGAVFLGIERLAHISTQPPNASLTDLSGTAIGGRVGVGTFLSPQWSAQVEFAYTKLLQNTMTISPPVPQPLVVPGTPGPTVIVVPVTQQVQRDYRAPERRRSDRLSHSSSTPRRDRVSGRPDVAGGTSAYDADLRPLRGADPHLE